MAITPITINDLTEAKVAGTGVFDILMEANKAHLDSEFTKGRIKGAEYATVYLGSLEAVMKAALDFLLQKQKISLEAQLLEQQIILAQVEVLKANAAVALLTEQTQNAIAERGVIEANKDKLLQEAANLALQAINIPKEGKVLDAQECKLRAEFDLITAQILKTGQENALLLQKVATEKAQTQATGVDDNSVIGKQKKLYTAQAEGFVRDAEQKAAKVMVDSWNVRRTTDEGTVADGTNNLNDVSVGRAVSKLLQGVGA